MGLFGTKKRETVLVMELSSGSVSGAFLLREKGQTPLIIDTAKREFPRREIVDPARLKDDLITALTEVLTGLRKSWKGRPDKIFMVLGAPWSSADLRSVEYKSDHDFRFTEKLGTKIISAEIKKISKEDNSILILDHKTMEVLLNGYSVDSPNNKLCHSAEIKCLFSFASEELLSTIRDHVHRAYPMKIIFSNCVLVDFINIRDLSPDVNDMIVVHVGAEVTEVLLLGHGRLSGMATFPIGERTIIRKSAQSLGKGLPETDSIFSLMLSESLDESIFQKSKQVFSLAREDWQEGFKEVLLALAPGRHIPHNIFFSSPTPMNGYLRDGMLEESFPEFTTGNLGFNAIIIDMNMLHAFVSWKEGAMRDPRIAMNAIFINRSLG